LCAEKNNEKFEANLSSSVYLRVVCLLHILLIFQLADVLHRDPVIKFRDDLQYTAVSVTTATKEDMTSEAEPHFGVENCTCSPDSNTQGACSLYSFHLDVFLNFLFLELLKLSTFS